jgi:hypothetical protein
VRLHHAKRKTQPRQPIRTDGAPIATINRIKLDDWIMLSLRKNYRMQAYFSQMAGRRDTLVRGQFPQFDWLL